MKKEQLSDALSHLDEDLVEEAATHRRFRRRWVRYVALAACLCLVVGAALQFLLPRRVTETEGGGLQQNIGTSGILLANKNLADHALALAHYPQMAQYPVGETYNPKWGQEYEAWAESRDVLHDQPEGYNDGLLEFTRASAREFLTNAEGANLVYSPVNVYMALSLLTEISAGQTQAELLTLLGAPDLETSRDSAQAIWRANYCDDGAWTSVLANSLWLSDSLTYNEDTVATLAEEYYCSTFRGQMGSEAYDELMRAWLNDQTGGLLEDAVQEVSTDPRTLLTLLSTIYYQARWDAEFNEANTEEATFHGTAGEETVEFMNQSGQNTYYWNDDFAAVNLGLAETEGGYMWLVLPDEGVDLDTVLQGEALYELLQSNHRNPWENQKTLIVNLSMPKFDVSSQLDLTQGLRNLGAVTAFAAGADLTNLVEEAVAAAEVNHAARVVVDEEGVTATAFTEIMYCGAGMPPEDEVDFVLDRPFIFAITGVDNSVLFLGLVNCMG